MKSNADTSRSDSKAAANSIVQKKKEGELAFEDKRPATLVQRKLQDIANSSSQVTQRQTFQEIANTSAPEPLKRKEGPEETAEEKPEPQIKQKNNTGLPDNLKSGIEHLSGIDISDVKVHYNSSRPAQLKAHAYAQGTNIHVASGQERHLPHEAWHVVQQKQGRVHPTIQMKGGHDINDDTGLEREADVMGMKALSYNRQTVQSLSFSLAGSRNNNNVIQRVITEEQTRELLAISLVDDLLDYLAAPISEDDVPDAIELWLKNNPGRIGRRKEIYERANVYFLEEIRNATTYKYLDLFVNSSTGLKYRYASTKSALELYLVDTKDDGLYEYNIRTKVFKKHALSGFHEKKELDEKQSTAAKKIILGDDVPEEGDVEVKPTDVDAGSLATIVAKLNAYAATELEAARQADDTDIDIGSESSHDAILQRAIQDILSSYGLAIDYARAVQGTQVKRDLTGASLSHATDRWEQADEETKKSEGREAVLYGMSDSKDAAAAITTTQKAHHKKSSEGAVREGYANVICEAEGNTALINSLAEVRLKWGPFTRGENIYLRVKEDKTDFDYQWGLYKTLIHEALHTAEHPGFTSFLYEHIPEGHQSYLKEGMVDYLAHKIWTQVLAKITIVRRRADGNTPAAGAGEGLKLLKSEKDRLIADPLYSDEVGMVVKLVKALENGDLRLLSAYFAGNVAAFLPKMNKEEDDEEVKAPATASLGASATPAAATSTVLTAAAADKSKVKDPPPMVGTGGAKVTKVADTGHGSGSAATGGHAKAEAKASVVAVKKQAEEKQPSPPLTTRPGIIAQAEAALIRLRDEWRARQKPPSTKDPESYGTFLEVIQNMRLAPTSMSIVEFRQEVGQIVTNARNRWSQ